MPNTTRDWSKPLTEEEAKSVTLDELFDHPSKRIRELAFKMEFEENLYILAQKRTMPQKRPSQ